jgi:predicted enzyme related to lactoylglutathione lyase
VKLTDNRPGYPCWAQLSTTDLEASKQFYGRLFDWTATTDPDPQYGGYTTFFTTVLPPRPSPR